MMIYDDDDDEVIMKYKILQGYFFFLGGGQIYESSHCEIEFYRYVLKTRCHLVFNLRNCLYKIMKKASNCINDGHSQK